MGLDGDEAHLGGYPIVFALIWLTLEDFLQVWKGQLVSQSKIIMLLTPFTQLKPFQPAQNPLELARSMKPMYFLWDLILKAPYLQNQASNQKIP